MKQGRPWILVLQVCCALACGGDDNDAGKGSQVDGGEVDGGEEPDASSGLGLVTFTFAPPFDEPAVGHDVLFLREDGSVIDIVQTDEQGRAQAMFDAPGTVVLHDRHGVPTTQDDLYAYLGVPPGTDIKFGRQRGDLGASITVTGPSHEDATDFGVTTQCGQAESGDPTVTVELQNCPPEIELLWTVSTSIDGETQGFSAYTPPFSLKSGSVDVAGPLRPHLLQSSRISGLPDAIPVRANYTIFSERGLRQDGPAHSVMTVDGAAVFVDPLPDLRELGMLGNLSADFFADGHSTLVFAWVTHDGTPDIDVGSMLPVHVADLVLDQATETLTWSESGEGPLTAVEALVFGSTASGSLYWRVLAPHRGNSIRLPRLPPPFDQFNITSDTPVNKAVMNGIRHIRGYGPVLSTIDSSLFDIGEPGDIFTVRIGGGAIVQ